MVQSTHRLGIQLSKLIRTDIIEMQGSETNYVYRLTSIGEMLVSMSRRC
ncbi:MAG: hypothetical protein GU355_09595 [Caldivirga sp.]|nr:hypothetical protein [Caldivirga sp. MU80]NAZ29525.1 hypothetical protein [Caldivirga sp.]